MRVFAETKMDLYRTRARRSEYRIDSIRRLLVIPVPAFHSNMDEFTIRCRDLTLTARYREGVWISTIDGHGEKRVSIKNDERSAKDACLQVALAMLRRRGDSIPMCLTNPQWSRGAVLDRRIDSVFLPRLVVTMTGAAAIRPAVNEPV